MLRKNVGRFEILQRERACYPDSTCSNWTTSTTRPVTAPFATLNTEFSTAAVDQFHLNKAGDVVAELVENTPRLTLVGDLQSDSWGASLTPSGVSQALSLTFDPTSPASSVEPVVAYTWRPSRGCPNGHCLGQDAIPGTSPTKWAGGTFSVSGKATSSCVLLLAARSERVKDAQKNDYALESQLVIKGSYATATCKATTCADAKATCGDVSDGCGGTLSCGTCEFNETCDVPSGGAGRACRRKTRAEECAAQGKVTCNGGWDCWDACF